MRFASPFIRFSHNYAIDLRLTRAAQIIPALMRTKAKLRESHSYTVICMKSISIDAEFGWLTVNGVKYEKDIIIHSNGKITKREKKKSKDLKSVYGHTPLSERELGFLSEEKFEVLYVGIGHEAALPTTPEAKQILDKYNAVILPTLEIIRLIEQEKRKFVAIIHITC
jgi:hypothetical protein